MRDLLLTILVFGSVPFIFLRPHLGLLIWSWLGYMNPHRLTWGFAYDFPFVQVVAGATMLAMVFAKEKKRFPWSGLTVVWSLFVVWMSVTTVFALNADGAVSEWERTIKIQLMVLVTLLLINTPERINSLVWVIVVSIGFFGVKGGLFTAMTGGEFRVWGPPGSFIEGNNEIAFALLITVPLMRYLQLQARQHWMRWGLLVAMGLCGLAIVGSYSRGAFVAVGAMLFVLWLKGRRKLVTLVPILVLAGVSLAFMPDKYFDRIETIRSYEEDASAMGRINAWWFAFRLAQDNPVTGGGFQTFTRELFLVYAPEPLDFHDSHSIYFEVMAEHGFVGLVLFLVLGLLVLRTGQRIVSEASKSETLRWAGDLAAMLQVSFVGYAVGGAFLGLAYFDLPYHLMALMVLTQQIVKQASFVGGSVSGQRGANSAVTGGLSRHGSAG